MYKNVQSESKIFGHISGLIFPHQKNEKFILKYLFKQFSR